MPRSAIALRTSGHLLLGVVRIYHRKAKYLLADCTEALTKMKTAFRPGLLDLPEDNFEAAYQSITLPEEFHDFETPLPDVNAIDVAEHFTLNQSRAEDITLTEDYEANILLCDGNFDEAADALRRQSFFEGSFLMSSNSLVAEHNSASASGDKFVLQEDEFCFQHDCFGDEEDAADRIEILLRDEQNGLDKDILAAEEARPVSPGLPENSTAIESNCANTTVKDISHAMNETFLSFQEEGFVLEPVDDTAVTSRRKTKRKRRLLVDAPKELNGSTIYNQLTTYTDTLAVLDLAPPSRKTMMWKELGGVEQFLSHFIQPGVHADLQKLFEKCFSSGRIKMRGHGVQRRVPEMEEMQKEQDTTGMLPIEEPSYLQESAPSEAETNTGNDPLMLTTQNTRNETKENCDKTTQDGAAFSESSKNSLDQEAEAQQVKVPKEQKRIKKDSEEIRWSKRTLQLHKTLQHLKRSGVCSFSFRELCRNNNRKEAAAKFYVFLVLKKQLVLLLHQRVPFADLTATAGPLFDTV
ncbi:double-strand-break repair protein rad21-like protein 1 isoform X2 [Pithys albifrons albifrons]|uniref:double-strand-break repair protein rad21-like protein 1 isoform X2 n=1 Tax=Pithys albifrons albifrons TaxID=3385563 RepID=UPI003A5D1572